MGGVSHELKHAYAYSELSPFDDTKRDTVVLLSNIPVPAKQAKSQSALVKLAATGGLHALRVSINDEEEPASVLALSGELASLASGNALAVFDSIRFGESEIEGTLATRGEKHSMDESYTYQVSFRASVQ